MKKIIYYLVVFTIITSGSSFCQLEISPRQLIPEEHKLYRSLHSMVEEIKADKINSENLNIQLYLSSGNNNTKKIKKGTESLQPFFENRIFYEVEIIPLSAVIRQDSAEVSFKMIITAEDGSFQDHLMLKFVKESNVWILNDDDYSHRFLSFLDKNYNPLPTEAIYTFTIRENNKTLIPYRFTSDPEIWDINKNVTWAYLEKWLFANQSEIDMDLHWYGTDWPEDAAVFYLDPYWQRIVYSKYNSSDIKAFNLEFYPGAQFPSEPWGITTDDQGVIYVSDKRNNCIIKLIYIPSPNSIYFSSKMNISGLDGPTDVVYSSHTTPNNSTDDYLLIANSDNHNIIKTDLNGNVLNTITQFKTGGNYYDFISPTRIAQVAGTPYIAVIDEVLNYLIVGRIQESNTLFCHNVIKFSGGQHPKDVGVNCYGDIFVPDDINQIHKFTYIGSYLCTYQSNAFNFPLRISRINDLEWYIFDQISADRWSANNGLKRFIPGSDTYNLSHTQNSTEHTFSYYLSDFSQIRLEIINSSNQVIKTINYANMSSWRHYEIIPLNEIPIGDYKFRVNHRPLFDEYYGSYQQGWRFSEIPFSVPLKVTITGPTSAQRYSTSNFSSVTNAQGVSYYWEQMPICCTEEYDCGYYIYKGNGSSLSIYNSGYHYRLRLTVTDGANRSAQDIHHVTVEFCVGSGGGSGCPTLAVEVEGEMVDENPLLITSLSNPGIDVTDYYLINTEIEPVGDEINFTIHEPQTEHTWLDYVELIEVKVKSDELVAVNDEGEVINYKNTTAPVTVMLNDTRDITEILSELDTLDISLSEGDVLTVFREELPPGGDGDMVLGGEVPAKDQESFTISLSREKDIDPGIKSTEDENPPLGGLFFRKNKSIIAKSLRNLPPGNLEIAINKDLVLDYLALVKNEKTAKVTHLDLLEATHNQSGNVKDFLLGIDQNYVEIYPGEIIDFIFRKGNTPGHKTAYILKSVGRYETDTSLVFGKNGNLSGTLENNLIPKENKLYDNYPNPFNPTTQIKYSIKADGLVSLKVYDVLGNEVAKLVNEEKSAGTYTINFNASHLSSGIYFYRISAKDFHQTKKMLMIK